MVGAEDKEAGGRPDHRECQEESINELPGLIIMNDGSEINSVDAVFDQHENAVDRIIAFKAKGMHHKVSCYFRNEANPKENGEQPQMKGIMQPETDQAAYKANT